MRQCPNCNLLFKTAKRRKIDGALTNLCPHCGSPVYYIDKNTTVTKADYDEYRADIDTVTRMMDLWAAKKEQSTLAPFLLEGKALKVERRMANMLLEKCKRYTRNKVDYRQFAIDMIEEFFTDKYSYAHDAGSMNVLMGKLFNQIAAQVYRVSIRSAEEAQANKRRAHQQSWVSAGVLNAVI